MSLIHEALKKAEQQRRLGEPPSFGTPFAATRRPRSLLPYLALAIVGALGAGWWLSRGSAPDSASPATAASQPAAAGKTADAQAAAPAAGTAGDQAASSAAGRQPAMGANAVANTNVVTSLAPPPRLNHQAPAQDNPPTVKEVAERESEPHPPGANPLAPGEAAPLALGTPPPETPSNDPEGVAAKRAAKERQLAAAPATASATTQPATHKPPAFPSAAPPDDLAPPPAAAALKTTPAAPPSRPPPAAAQPANPAQAATQKPPPAAAPASPPPAAPQPAAAPPVATAAATPAPNAAPPLEQLPAYWQLPYNVRKELPALKLSMHVYSATPAQRFVVLNGNRQVEGDELGGDVHVTEIRSDGVVLSFQGQRFLVPRGGS